MRHTVAVDTEWLISLTALLVGTLVGLTGVGAGAIMTPTLVAVFGVPLPVAVATDLLFATVTKLFGVVFHHRAGTVDWGIAKKLWLGSIPGTLVGIGLVVFVASKETTNWLTWPLAVLVLLTAFILFRRALAPASAPSSSRHSGSLVHRRLLPIAGGFGIGSAVAMTSVGAGALGMALLVRLAPPGVKPQQLVGTDLVHAIPLALIAGIAYGSAGLVSWELLGWMVVGSIPGVILGTLLAGRFSPRVLNFVLSAILVTAVAMLVIKAA